MATKLEGRGGWSGLSGPATSGGTFFFAASLTNPIFLATRKYKFIVVHIKKFKKLFHK